MSAYFKELDKATQERYVFKLELAGLTIEDDPYSPNRRSQWSSDVSHWPRIEHPDIFSYFIKRPGTFTLQQLASWRQLEAYNYFKNNYVQTVFSSAGRSTVLKAKVNPSQRSPELAQEAWVIANNDGPILSAHCTCKAGLGEGCSHVAAILFKVECGVRLGYTSITAQLCGWNGRFSQKIEPARVVEMSFEHPTRKRDISMLSSPQEAAAQRPSKVIVTPSTHAKDQFLAGVKQVHPHAVIFSSLEPLVRQATATVIHRLPKRLTSLYQKQYETLSTSELQAVCQKKFDEGLIVMTVDEAAYLEESTKLQAQSIVWFEQRVGRITSSKFSSAIRASLNPPPASLVREIMERRNVSRSVPAIQWGISNEITAREAYLDIACSTHENLSFMPAGLHVDPDNPHLGASPDGLINCDCCGEGLIEIKCPYKYREVDPCTVTDSNFYLKLSDDSLHLDHSHAYYHQVQGQLAITGREYCDFVCWTPRGMHIERIVLDTSYFASVKPRLDAFFVRAVLPLLLTGRTSAAKDPSSDSKRVCTSAGKDPTSNTTSRAAKNTKVRATAAGKVRSITSRSDTTIASSSTSSAANASTPTPSSDETAQVYCFCQKEGSGRMIGCDNDSCDKQWFHYVCVGIKRKPKGTWFCSESCKSCYKV